MQLDNPLPPGPWEARRLDSNTLVVRSETTTICTIQHPHDSDQAQAVANLIVKAPDLLQKLQETTDELSKMLHGRWGIAASTKSRDRIQKMILHNESLMEKAREGEGRL